MGSIAEWEELDAAMHATLSNHVANEASMAQGGALLRVVAGVYKDVGFFKVTKEGLLQMFLSAASRVSKTCAFEGRKREFSGDLKFEDLRSVGFTGTCASSGGKDGPVGIWSFGGALDKRGGRSSQNPGLLQVWKPRRDWNTIVGLSSYSERGLAENGVRLDQADSTYIGL